MANFVKYVVFILIALQYLWHICEPKSHDSDDEGHGKGKGVGPNRRHRGRMAAADVESFRSACKGKCKGQSEKSKKKRDTIRRHMLRRQDVTGRSADDVDRQLNKMYLAKKALLVEQGLGDIEPHDNGVFGGDVVLSEEQADRIIAKAQGQRDPEDNAPDAATTVPQTTAAPVDDQRSREESRRKGKGKGKGWGNGKSRDRRRRASALSIDTYSRNKWSSTTINYYADPDDFTTKQRAVIKEALDYIQSKTCLKFVQKNQRPMIEYFKTDDDTDDGTCGWAYMGFQSSSNPVHINFNSKVCAPTIRGVIAHETMHTLGFSHEHTRHDRDNFIKMMWPYVDPQSYDMFDRDDPWEVNPFCVPYDYESIMHYDCFVASTDSSKPSFTPRNNADYYLSKIGNYNWPSTNDIFLINKLYCTPSTCKDVNPYCGYSCNDCATKYNSVCPKSCNQCTISR